MQLKKDTDYAIRLLLALAEPDHEKQKRQGKKLKVLCERAAVPRPIALRLCSLLADAGFLNKEERSDSIMITQTDDLLSKTVLDVINAVEGQSNLLAVFDRKTELFERYGLVLELLNETLSKAFGQMTIKTILDWERTNYLSRHGEERGGPVLGEPA